MKYFPSLSVIAIAAVCASYASAEIIITDIAGLQSINNNLSADYILANDIDATGFEFAPIGAQGQRQFTGVFDGNGHRIYGLSITSSGPVSSHNVGLFAAIGFGGKITNLELTNINYSAFSTGGAVVGGIAAQSYGGRIENSYVTGTINSDGASPGYGSFAGGIVGFASGIEILNTSSAVNIRNHSGGGADSGGLVGYNGGTISQSYATGSITGPSNASWVHTAGGLVGRNGGTISKSYAVGPVVGNYDTGGLVGANFGNIVDSYSTGSVDGGIGSTRQYVIPYLPGAGALVGFSHGGTITGSYATGSVTGGQNTPTGGLIGTRTGTTVMTSYWDTQTTGQTTSAGGTPLTTDQLQSSALPTGFDPRVWSATAGQYPKLTGVGGQQQAPSVQIPAPSILARLSLQAYSDNPVDTRFTVLNEYSIVGNATTDGFGVAVFQDSIYPDLVVIAVRGTDPSNLYNIAFNIVSDVALASGILANNILASNVNNLVRVLRDIHHDLPNAQIVLTGHSLGGALAHIVGNAAGVDAVTFDAPGAYGLFPPDSSARTDGGNIELAKYNLGHLSELNIASPDDGEISANYRLYGDQVSLVGQQFQSTVTKTVDDVSNFLVTSSVLLGPLGWWDQHRLENLVQRLSFMCADYQDLPGLPCANAQDGATGPNIIGDIARPIGTALSFIYNSGDLVSQTGGKLWGGITSLLDNHGDIWTQVYENYNYQTVGVGHTVLWDPPPGFGYLFEVEVGSPFISAVALPLLDPVYGWVLQYHDEFSWSVPASILSQDLFNFTTDVNALLFFSVDANGNSVYNPNSFLMAIAFASDGDVNATLRSFGPVSAVPEPHPLLVFTIVTCMICMIQGIRTHARRPSILKT